MDGHYLIFMIDQLTIAIVNYLKVLICIKLRICIWACRPLVPHSFIGAAA